MSVYKRHTDNGNKGKVVYNVGIVKGIVRLAVEEVSGVAIQKNNKSRNNVSDDIKINENDGKIDVNVTVSVYYGYSVPDVAFDIQQSIKHNVESMSKYKIGNIDVKVNGIIFSENNEEI